MHRTDIEAPSHDSRTEVASLSNLDRTVGRYANTHLAADLGVSEAAIRNWHLKCCEVCPVEWLKVRGKHTDLSAALLADYHARVSQGNLAIEAWVVEMRSQFESVQTTTVDVLPADTTLALKSNDATATVFDQYLEELGSEIVEATQKVDQLVADLEADELAMLQSEMEAARQKGAKKATLLYAAEKQGQNDTLQALRQREIERRRQGGQS